MPDRAAGPLARLANYQIDVQAKLDQGIVVQRPVFADPRDATTVSIPNIRATKPSSILSPAAASFVI